MNGSELSKSLEGTRLLIAEDEGLIAFDMEGILTSMGSDVVGPVARVEDVLRSIQRERLDGALLDVNLRGRQVFEVLDEVLRRGIKVILTSGYDDDTLFPPRFRDLPRLPKPFEPAALRRICLRIFGTPVLSE